MKNKILIVNPLFRDLFLKNAQIVLKDNYEVEEFFIHKNLKQHKFYRIYHKILNIFYINILKRRDYYNILKSKKQIKYYKYCLDNIKSNKYDKILLCRGDRIPNFVLIELSKLSSELINYQCDGVAMCPDIFQKKIYFSKIYSFEKEDIINYPELELDFITNFYFKNINDNTIKIEYDFFYLGVGIEQRIKILSELDTILSDYKKRFLLSYHKEKEKHNSIEYFIKPIDYKINLEESKKANCLIDLKLESHNGLSFRFFESIYFQKKIITNNKDVINYDLYHPNNILVVDYSELSKNKIEEFLNKEIVKIDEKIIEKYSFDNWLNRILKLT